MALESVFYEEEQGYQLINMLLEEEKKDILEGNENGLDNESNKDGCSTNKSALPYKVIKHVISASEEVF